jgi:hypothetical protein
VTLLPLALAGLGYLAWRMLSDTFTSDGAVRFREGPRKRIFGLLNSTSPVPVLQPAFPNATTWQILRFNPTAASSMAVVEGARSAGLPVAISENFMAAMASPNDENVFLVTMKRGQESSVAGPGSGFALIVD